MHQEARQVVPLYSVIHFILETLHFSETWETSKHAHLENKTPKLEILPNIFVFSVAR